MKEGAGAFVPNAIKLISFLSKYNLVQFRNKRCLGAFLFLQEIKIYLSLCNINFLRGLKPVLRKISINIRKVCTG